MKKVYIAAVAAIVSLFVPQVASLVHACGGTFCDAGPQTMPVDQTGENILYVMDGQTVEAHIQIQYKGAAGRFAWVLPVQALPTFQVGSQPMFDSMLQGTVPNVQVQNTSACQVQNNGSAGTGGGFPGSGGSGGSGTGGPNNPPVIVKQEQVGAFDITVLKGGSVQELVDWLNTNGYQQNPEAPPILQEYLTKNYLFVAVKLVSGSDTGDLHPLVVKYPGTEPCIPLKLTKIAATEDMGVRAFFLGNDRVVAKNYKNIELNMAQIDWQNLGSNYNQVVASAADSPVVNGHGFVTEYAGTSSVVPNFNLYSPVWKAEDYLNIGIHDVMSVLQKQSLANCSAASCYYTHPLVPGLLHEFVPVPVGVDEEAFYSCLSCYADKIDESKWDGVQFAQRFNERIVVPGKHALDLLQKWPKLTRLYTTISPVEMTEDPEFVVRKNLPDVSNFLFSNRTNSCNVSWVTTPGEHQVMLENVSSPWPMFSNEMPYAERIVEYPEMGDPIVLVDNKQKIDDLLAAYNSQFPMPITDSGGGGMGSGGGMGAGFSGSGGTTFNGAGANNPGSPTAGQGGTNGSVPTPEGDTGCQYPAGKTGGVPTYMFTVGALTFLLYRWRRRS
jgi:uncharacterized membrane protein YgcG